MAIQSETEFQAALRALPSTKQRVVAARFAEHVLGLCKDPRVAAAIQSAQRSNVSDAELTALRQAAKSANVDSYTQCGKEADWLGQAGHFVAEAAIACVAPADSTVNLAWEAAMRARMARTCEAIANGRGTENNEAQEQYRLLNEYLHS